MTGTKELEDERWTKVPVVRNDQQVAPQRAGPAGRRPPQGAGNGSSGERGKATATAARHQGQQVASTAGQQGQEVVGTAAQQAREMTATVKEQANQLTQELSGQGRALYQETRQQLQAQAETQTQHLTEALYRWSYETQALVDGRPEEAGTVGRYAEECAHKLQDVASGIQARGVDGMLEDLQLFARRRPGAFLLGAAVIGFGGGRLVRSAKAKGADDGSRADGLQAQPQLAPPSGRVRRSPVVAGQGRPATRAGAGAPRDARSRDGA